MKPMAATAPPIASICASSACGGGLQLRHLGLDRGVAVEEVVVFQQVGLVGEDLLHPHRPLLVPGPGQARAPRSRPAAAPRGRGRVSTGSRPASRSGCGRRCSPAAARSGPASSPARRSGSGGGARPRCRSGSRRSSSHISAKARILHISVTKRMPALTKNETAADHGGEVFGRHLGAQVVEHGDGGRQRVGELLFRRRPGLLQVIAADVHRVPFRQVARGIGGDVGGQPQRGRGRQDVGAARQVFLDDVVLHRALQRGDCRRPVPRPARCRAPAARARWR